MHAYVILPGGSDGAQHLLRSCQWPDKYASKDENHPDLSAHVVSTYDVIHLRSDLLPCGKKVAADFGMNDDRWTVRHFRSELGFDTVAKNTVVLDPSGRILAVYTADLGAHLGVMTGDDFSRVFRTFSRVYASPQKGDNRGIFMHGHKVCPSAAKGSGSIDGTYYVTKAGQNISSSERAEIVDLYAAFTRIEKEQAPSIGKFKLDAALRMGFPGLFPGVPSEIISTAAVGMSRGFTSGLHSDFSTIESIFWDSSGIPDGDDYAFVIYESGLLFDLKASRFTSIIFPAHRWHGTLRCDTPTQPHLGLGAALILKNNVLDPAKKGIMDKLKERLAELEEAEPGCTTLGSAAFLGRNFRETDQSQKVAVVGRL
jgi:hypothetical protein